MTQFLNRKNQGECLDKRCDRLASLGEGVVSLYLRSQILELLTMRFNAVMPTVNSAWKN